MAECWVANISIFYMIRNPGRFILLNLAIVKDIYTIITVYAPKTGLPVAEKDNLYDELRPVVAEIPTSEIFILLGDWNGHDSKSSVSYGVVHIGHSWRIRNMKGENLLPFAVSCNPVIGKASLKNQPNHPITFTLHKGRTQIDYVLFCKTFRKHVRAVKVIPGEEIAKQSHLLFCIFSADIHLPAKKKFVPHLRTWHLREPEAQSE